MRWALMGSFECSNRELLALYICRDMTFFVVHKGSPRVPRESQGRPWDVPGACPGSQGRPRGSQGRAQGIPGIPGGSGDVPGIPGIFFIKMIP